MKPMPRCNASRTRRRNVSAMLTRALLLASCAMAGLGEGCTPRVVVKVDHCTGWAAIRPAKADVLTDGTAKQILAHDQHGIDMGCWPAPAKAKPAPKR